MKQIELEVSVKTDKAVKNLGRVNRAIKRTADAMEHLSAMMTKLAEAGASLKDLSIEMEITELLKPRWWQIVKMIKWRRDKKEYDKNKEE